MLAVGNFPPHIKPIVFSWPNGGALSYFSALKEGAKSDMTRQDLLKALDSFMYVRNFFESFLKSFVVTLAFAKFTSWCIAWEYRCSITAYLT
jgi:hypothetical protein